MGREVVHGPLLAKIYSSFPLDLKLETVGAVNVDVHLLSLAPQSLSVRGWNWRSPIIGVRSFLLCPQMWPPLKCHSACNRHY